MARKREQPSCWVFRYGAHLKGATAADQEFISKLKDGVTYEISIKEAKNEKAFRKMWSMFRLIAENQEFYADAEAMSVGLRVELRYLDPEVTLLNGGVIVQARHFSDFSAKELSEFIDKALVFVSEHLIVGLDVEALKREREIVAPEDL